MTVTQRFIDFSGSFVGNTPCAFWFHFSRFDYSGDDGTDVALDLDWSAYYEGALAGKVDLPCANEVNGVECSSCDILIGNNNDPNSTLEYSCDNNDCSNVIEGATVTCDADGDLSCPFTSIIFCPDLFNADPFDSLVCIDESTPSPEPKPTLSPVTQPPAEPSFVDQVIGFVTFPFRFLFDLVVSLLDAVFGLLGF